jgi:hypothetical protein
MNAFVYPKDISLRKMWEEFENDELKKTDSNMNEYLLKLISLYKQEYCASNYVFHIIPGLKIKKKEDSNTTEIVLIKSKDEFMELWKGACNCAGRALEKIMNLGKNDFGAVKVDFVPNTTIIPVMGAVMLLYEKVYGRTLPRDEFDKTLSKWYWSAVISEDYSGSSDSVMSEDFRDLKTWFVKKDTSAFRRIKRANEHVKTIDLKTHKKGSTIYNCLLCSIALNKAEDFYTTRILDTGSFKEEKIHDHHIFPTRAQGYSPKKTKNFNSTHDSILNRTLLLDETNGSILSSRPSQYLEEVKKRLDGDETRMKALMEKHIISINALGCMKNDDYDGFITEREKTMKEKLIALLDQ